MIVPGEALRRARALAERRLDLKFPEPRYTKGVLAKYAKLALGAEFGAVTSA